MTHGARASLAGDQDHFEFDIDSTIKKRLSAVRFAPKRDTQNIHPTLGMLNGASRRAVFHWLGLSVKAGAKAEFKALVEQNGAEYANLSSAKTSYYLVVQTADGSSGTFGAKSFGPYETGANGRMRTRVNDWPTANQLAWELDSNGDGKPDKTGVSSGVVCTSADTDENGIPDACEASAPKTPVGK